MSYDILETVAISKKREKGSKMFCYRLINCCKYELKVRQSRKSKIPNKTLVKTEKSSYLKLA